MTESRSETLPENPAYLVMLAVPPALWMAHFLLCYITASVWCARFAGPGGTLTGIRPLIGIYTVAALAGIIAAGWSGYRRHRYGGADTAAHEFDSAEDRHRFLGFATLLLAGLSTVATVFVAVAALSVETCH